MCQEKKPRVHSECIKAWADGATIQCSPDNGDSWIDVTDPSWSVHLLYRVKPAKKSLGQIAFGGRNQSENLARVYNNFDAAEKRYWDEVGEAFMRKLKEEGYI